MTRFAFHFVWPWHWVAVDAQQIAWFVKTVEEHPFEEGWQIFCFSHAPIIGSGLRVLQECHVVNGTATQSFPFQLDLSTFEGYLKWGQRHN